MSPKQTQTKKDFEEWLKAFSDDQPEIKNNSRPKNDNKKEKVKETPKQKKKNLLKLLIMNYQKKKKRKINLQKN